MAQSGAIDLMIDGAITSLTWTGEANAVALMEEAPRRYRHQDKTWRTGISGTPEAAKGRTDKARLLRAIREGKPVLDHDR